MFQRFRRLRLSRPLAFLDLETTGTNPAVDRIVELAILRFEPQGKPASFCRRVDPQQPIPAAATQVHGITDADVNDAPTFAQVQPKVQRYLHGCDLAGYNLKRFDLPLLAAEFERCGERLPLAGRAVIDVQEIYHEFEPRDLASAARYYLNRQHRDAHSALADVIVSAAVLDAQLGCYRELPRKAKALARRYQEVDLAGRFRLEGEVVVFAFGKHQGRPLDEVATRDPEYLGWMLQQSFLDDVKSLVCRALRAAATDR